MQTVQGSPVLPGSCPAAAVGGDGAMNAARRKGIAYGRLIDIITLLSPGNERRPMNMKVSYLMKQA